MKKSGWWKGLIKYVLGVALLVLVVSLNWTGLNELMRRTPDPGPFFLAALITTVVTGIQYYRWYLLVRALGLPFTLRNAVRLGLVGTFYNTFLPGSVGGDLVKAYFIAKGHPEQRATAVATVIADRLVGLFGLIFFAAAVGGGFWYAGNEKIEANEKLQLIIMICIGLATAGATTFTIIGLFPTRLADALRDRLGRLPVVGKTASELWYVVRTYSQMPRTILTVVAMSAVIHTGFVVNYHLAVRVFPPEQSELLGSLPEHFVIAPIGYIVQALIPVPGGLGGGELTFGGLYKLIRGPAGEPVGLAGRLTMRLIEWTLGGCGYIAYLRMKTELPVEEDKETE